MYNILIYVYIHSCHFNKDISINHICNSISPENYITDKVLNSVFIKQWTLLQLIMIGHREQQQ